PSALHKLPSNTTFVATAVTNERTRLSSAMSDVTFGTTVGVELCLSWRPASGSEIPDNAADAGGECYVIRAEHKGEWVPGKLVRGQACAYISFGGRELPVQSYQVLVHSCTDRFGIGFTWAPVRDGVLPQRALVAGSDRGSPLFVVRGKCNGEVCTGKAVLGHNRAYVPYGGEERALDSFEVLVFNCGSK
uniref:DUF3421 domain-containing protein n=2 Tax=Macrostomum lignano TaxID=282301 RepID=A0A1I8JAC8_9PLAT